MIDLLDLTLFSKFEIKILKQTKLISWKLFRLQMDAPDGEVESNIPTPDPIPHPPTPTPTPSIMMTRWICEEYPPKNFIQTLIQSIINNHLYHYYFNSLLQNYLKCIFS